MAKGKLQGGGYSILGGFHGGVAVELLEVQRQRLRTVGFRVAAYSHQRVRLLVEDVLQRDDDALEILRPLLYVVADLPEKCHRVINFADEGAMVPF